MESDVSATKRWKLAWRKWNGGNVSWFILDFVNLDSALVIAPGMVVTCRDGLSVVVREVFAENGILRVANRPAEKLD
jgi:hypothetical protein